MCGINGLVHFSKALAKRNQIQRMNEKLKHRGPDNEGIFIHKNVGLGYLRLTIIDTTEQQQPILHTEDENYWIAFNGEVYNYRELKQELINNGHVFYTQTDTEVVLHMYQEYDEKCVTFFNGMFAFALFDKRKNKLFIARDRLGIKPLYYYYDNEKLVFSSEIKAILTQVGERQLDEHALFDYVMFRTPLHEKTFFKNISLLKAGHYLTVDLTAQSYKGVPQQYWDISFDYKKYRDIHEVISCYKQVLEKAVARHLISDVPLGCYLSGGFDSSTIAVTAAQKISSRLETFTGAFEEGTAFDERERSRKLGAQLNAIVMEATITPAMFLKAFKEVIYYLDEPKVGSPAIAQYYVAKLAAKHVKVVLTGHGGDELFLGYIPYKTIFFKQQLKKNPLLFRQLGKNIDRKELLPFSYYLFYSLFRKELSLGIFTLFSKKELQALFSEEFKLRNKKYNPQDELAAYVQGKNFTKLQQSQYFNLKIFLPALFIVEDKMSMAHSIESRVPFCDNEMIDFALSVPEEYKLYNGINKYIVKEAMKNSLPKEFFAAKKMGFPTPFKKWFAEEIKEYVANLLLSEQCRSRGIFNHKTIEKLFQQHVKGKKDYSYQLWSLMSIEMWFRLFIDNTYENYKIENRDSRTSGK